VSECIKRKVTGLYHLRYVQFLSVKEWDFVNTFREWTSWIQTSRSPYFILCILIRISLYLVKCKE
jgi:hypothetical protein